MTEKELINKLRELREISPKKDWVFLNKIQILGEEKKKSVIFGAIPGFKIFSGMIFGHKPVLVAITAFVVFFGFFGFAQNSTPGDLLFSVKRITERGQAAFVSEIDMPQANLELASKRLEELAKIAQANQVNKLAPALNEFQTSVDEATKSLSKLEATSSDPVVIQKIVDRTKKLEGRVQEIRSLGVVIGEQEINELQGASSRLEVKLLISDLETRTLTKEQEEILNQMKELAEKEEYLKALQLLTEFNQESEEETEEAVDEEETDKQGEGEESGGKEKENE